jgi:GNAT superfamily N-acetyltransferase
MATSGVTVTLTPATSADANQLVALRIAAMQESLERVGRFDAARARERFLSGFAPAYTRHIEVDGERAGFVVVKPLDHEWLLDHLYVHPDFQNRGIGSAVLSIVFSEADAARKALRVGALRESESNRFYLRHGFRKIDESTWDVYYRREAKDK